MEYFYQNAKLPDDENLLNVINSSVARLHKKFDSLDIGQLDISEYNKVYFSGYFKNIYSTLKKYTFILSWSLSGISAPLEDSLFVEYGGGSGMMSLMAKEAGVGKVIYNDIYDVSCKDAETIAENLEIRADAYINGDIESVISFLSTNHLSCDAIASYDVIEHIHDIETFFKRLPLLSRSSLSVSMASSANSYDPLKTKKLTKRHKKMEYEDRFKKKGYKKRDCQKAYFQVRKKMISEYAHKLSDQKINDLAIATRGRMKPAIFKAVDDYISTGSICEPDHPSNTCDPFTGNWAERLMDFDHLQNILRQEGFAVSLLGGYHGTSSPNLLKRNMGKAVNCLITGFAPKTLFLAPFLNIHAIK